MTRKIGIATKIANWLANYRSNKAKCKAFGHLPSFARYVDEFDFRHSSLCPAHWPQAGRGKCKRCGEFIQYRIAIPERAKMICHPVKEQS